MKGAKFGLSRKTSTPRVTLNDLGSNAELKMQEADGRGNGYRWLWSEDEIKDDDSQYEKN